jgi:predicted  nucleic acid-binding Zn-ribbon protein
MDRIFDQLERIQQLWKELERLKPNTIEYERLVEKIRALSAEYVALIDAPKKPRTK